MVIEETVQKVSFFKYVGAFSVSKNSRDMLASLNSAAELLNDPENMVLIFPQGKLHSNFADEVNFEKGLSRIMEAAAGKFHTIAAATFIENLQYRKPMASVYLKALGDVNNMQDAQADYQQHYDSGKQQQNKITV